VLIERDHTTATYVASSVLACGLIFASVCTARGDEPALQTIELRTGAIHSAVHSAAPTVAVLLAEQGITLGPNDETVPRPDARLSDGSIVRVVRVSHITKTLLKHLAAPVRRRFDATLALGQTRTLDPGRSGLRETIVRVERRDDGSPPRISRITRLVRAARPALVAIGTAPQPHEFVEVARTGFNAAVRFANKALNMIATAYTAGCYGCSGITAFGLHAGHGVVAVDPRVIPLGTKLYVPGYGPAVAGDIGGAIRGRRIDLGFNSLAEALRFGRREITVYVLN
jgi:3D (Asp-Asp-Asp) domain-containing protein